MTAHHPDATEAPAEIRSNVPGSFARGVLTRRHPALIRQVRDAIPLGPRQHRALDRLEADVARDEITPLDDAADDHSIWNDWAQGYYGQSWLDAPFLWAESYFYRKLLAATGYFESGPWRGVDIFAPSKQAELHSKDVDAELRALDELPRQAERERERGEVLLQSSLWGNQADLGFAASSNAPAEQRRDERLVVDDRTRLWDLLAAGTPGTIAVLADNVGRELIPDLVLIDHLLRHHAERVVLYVKPYPYYVSDATAPDTFEHLRRLAAAPGEAGAVGQRLWSALATGPLEIRAHSFFCAPLEFNRMPADLHDELAECALTILKGDLNYRRLVGDRAWDPVTPFERTTAYFPSPVAALRTLKSDVIVGMAPERLDELEASGSDWRTSGTHALVQLHGVTERQLLG
ncbi:protein-glutamate O-methyltransferase family protein [Streptomyces sp. A7024]|uniref:Protein-glutamate O-methyltransferase family protein n=1 Tax=Streptomyces coryli TaxID=1128680 RepID=A0A6G4TUP2_9ACTN|nr:damage-control phosphatase ARMT1 family protein [Streptomyces coryli]NGN62818.1 protein-glutamate O-methyltransferase family protein [Streptomyces coryli]